MSTNSKGGEQAVKDDPKPSRTRIIHLFIKYLLGFY